MIDYLKWDLRFLEMAKLVSTFSKDPSTKCGAVIVRANNTVQSVGFNGFPAIMEDVEEHYQHRGEKLSRIIHAEVNALMFAKDSTGGSSLYTYPMPCCDRCIVQMLQAGISRFVFPKPTEEQVIRWGSAFNKGKQYITELQQIYPWFEYKEVNF